MEENSTALPQELTQLLLAWQAGDPQALEQFVGQADGELRRLARHYLREEQSDHILQTTALVNEAWLRLLEWSDVQWQSRAHFFGLAAHLMRRILVDEARHRKRQKRGGELRCTSLSGALNLPQQKPPEVLALDDALTALAELDARRARIVEMRFFGGLSVEETATVLGISRRTVVRESSLAQAWLYRELANQ